MLFRSPQKKIAYANYETPERYITVLVLNDLIKREALVGYYAAPYQKKQIDIICLESQEELFRSLYSKANIIIYPFTKEE